MIGQRSFARTTALVFVAVIARELVMLPSRIACKTSWVSSWRSGAIGGIAKLTMRIGLIVSRFIYSQPDGRNGVGPFSKEREPKSIEPTVDPSIPDAVDATEQSLGPTTCIGPAMDATRFPVVPIRRRAKGWDRSLADRKLWLLKRSGLVGGDTKGARIERACTLEDLRKAYKLVHEVYLGTGYITPEAAGMRLRIFEMSPDMATFVAKVDGHVVGVLSVVEDSPELGLPSDGAFHAELETLRASGQRLCEITNQAVAEEYRKSSVPTELMRCAVAHLTMARIDQAVATVSPKHSSFYDLVGFGESGPVRNYSEKLRDLVVILAMKVDRYRQKPDDLNEAEQFIHHFLTDGNPYLARIKEWAKEARRHFIDAELLAQLFVTERNFIAECSSTELEVLHRRWGRELFSDMIEKSFIPSTENLVRAAMPGLFGDAEAPMANGQN